MTKYRIVFNRPFYEPQVHRWWWPFWCAISEFSLCISEDEARKAIRRHKNPAVSNPVTVVYEGDGE